MIWSGQDMGETEVVMVFWPAQAARVAELRAEGVPRLIVVSGDAQAPQTFDDREEWVRFPGESADLVGRLEALRSRLAHVPRPKPRLDQDGRLHVGKRAVDLSASEASLAAVFLADFECLVTKETLVEALPQPARIPRGRNIHRTVATSYRKPWTNDHGSPTRGYIMSFGRGVDSPSSQHPMTNRTRARSHRRWHLSDDDPRTIKGLFVGVGSGR